MIGRLVRLVSMTGALFVLTWPLILYPALLKLVGASRSRRSALRTMVLPTMTVVLPTYREVANVANRLANICRSSYAQGRLSVIVVDSGSQDGTAAAARRFAEGARLPIEVIVEDERRGKAAAINTAIAACRSDIIVITDAPTVFEPDALARIADAFADPGVGAATGYFEVTGEGSALQDEEQRFWTVRNLLRTLEADADSTPFLSGELCAFRRELVPGLDEDTLADDMNVALQVRRRGYRVVIVPEARFSERRTGEAAELLETKSRRAAGGIQELLRFRGMMFSRRHGLFGMLILPSAMLYYLPLRLPAMFVLWRSRNPLLVPFKRGLLPGGASLLIGLVAGRRFGGQARMLLFNEYVFALGWWRIIRRRMDVRWSQERSTREREDDAA